jgi:hypothetical protein
MGRLSSPASKIRVTCTVVDNPVEKGYKSVKLIHPLHGRKYLGCFRKLNAAHQRDIEARIALNCGVPVDAFEFIWA